MMTCPEWDRDAYLLCTRVIGVAWEVPEFRAACGCMQYSEIYAIVKSVIWPLYLSGRLFELMVDPAATQWVLAAITKIHTDELPPAAT